MTQRPTLSLTTFLDRIGPALHTLPSLTLHPRVTDEVLHRLAPRLAGVTQHFYPEQLTVALATAHALLEDRWAILRGEMATGKTRMAIGASLAAHAIRTVVLAPPHLLDKWQREIQTLLPHAAVFLLKRPSDIETWRAHSASLERPVFGVLSRERAKLSYRRTSALIPKRVRTDDGVSVAFVCPDCWRPPFDPKTDLPLTPDTVTPASRCSSCHSPLMTVHPRGPRRIDLTSYLARFPRSIDLVIADEAHEYTHKGTAQTHCLDHLSALARACLYLTGTLSNGKASSLFRTLRRRHASLRAAYGYHDDETWITHYGVRETRIITPHDPERCRAYGAQSTRREYVTVRERPGLSPALIPYLLGNTAFLALTDLQTQLPPYEEHLTPLQLPTSLRDLYHSLETDLKTLIRTARREKDFHLATRAVHALLRFPDHAWRDATLTDRTGQPQYMLPTISPEEITPKEAQLIELCRDAVDRHTKALVYVTYTRVHSIIPHLIGRLQTAGLRATGLPASVSAERRERWITDHEAEWDVLLTNPRMVNTGLDLLSYPTIIVYEPEYSVFTFRQAARRSWRPGQRFPVHVHLLYYEHTAQALAWQLIGAGIRHSLHLEGIIPQHGFAAELDDQEDDILHAIMHHLTAAGASSALPALHTLFPHPTPTENRRRIRIAPSDDSPKHAAPAYSTVPFQQLSLFDAPLSA